VKVELFPEDVLLDYVAGLLRGENDPAVPGLAYLKHFPVEIEFSQDFPARWQALVEPAFKRFVASTFGLRKFMFEVNGHVTRFSATDPGFWENVDLEFSQRAAQRLYEYMVFVALEIEPVFPLVLPADAILVSICLRDFSRYSFAWLLKNNAGWLVKALFMTWQSAKMNDLAWLSLLKEPAEVELPLRDYCVEKVADYLCCCSQKISAAMTPPAERKARIYTAEQIGGLELSLRDGNRFSFTDIDYVTAVIEQMRSAIKFWTGTGTVAIDDEKFIAGASRQFGLDLEIETFTRIAREYGDGIGMEERIYESILLDQIADTRSVDS
jgi:hypothetical protein